MGLCISTWRTGVGVALLIAWATAATAAQTVVLPGWVCAHPDSINASSFEDGETAIPHAASNGSGGAYPGNRTRTVAVPGLGSQTYYLYVPTNYDENRVWPLLLALHGAGGPGTSDKYAQQVRSDWSATAEANGFIVAAPVGSDSNGGWIAPASAADHPTDYDIFAAIFADLDTVYNIEDSRRYGWGFSAGGHVMHDLALNNFNSVVNGNSLAAYSVNAGVLAGLACSGLSVSGCKQQVLVPAPRKVPVDIHIGTSDSLFAYAKSDDAAFAASGWVSSVDLYYVEFVGTHMYYPTNQFPQIWRNLCPNAVIP